jgi:hypothetical protein
MSLCPAATTSSSSLPTATTSSSSCSVATTSMRSCHGLLVPLSGGHAPVTAPCRRPRAPRLLACIRPSGGSVRPVATCVPAARARHGGGHVCHGVCTTP